MHFISMTHKHRELKFYHKLYIYIGGWPVLIPIVAFAIFSHTNQIDYWTTESLNHPFNLLLFLGFLTISGCPVYKRIKMLSGIKNGILSQAHLFCKTISSHGDSENPTKYKYTFKFLDEDGNKHDHSLKSQRKKRTEDESEEIIIYLKENPKRAVVLDNLPRPLNTQKRIGP